MRTLADVHHRWFFHRLAAAASLALATLLGLAGCSPALNWRDARLDNTSLALLLPCKPDKAQKAVSLGGQATTVRMLGCDAGGMTFAAAVAEVGQPERVAAVQAQWQAATRANIKATAAAQAGPADPAVSPVGVLRVPGAAPVPAPVLDNLPGQRADGSPVSGQAAYFAQGTQVFQMVIYGERISPDAAQTFFGSPKFER